MTTLQMDIETARSTQGNIMDAYVQLSSLLGSLDTMTNALNPAWSGLAANQYHMEFDEWKGDLTRSLQRLEMLGDRLAAEISEWENMASKLA